MKEKLFICLSSIIISAEPKFHCTCDSVSKVIVIDNDIIAKIDFGSRAREIKELRKHNLRIPAPNSACKVILNRQISSLTADYASVPVTSLIIYVPQGVHQYLHSQSIGRVQPDKLNLPNDCISKYLLEESKIPNIALKSNL